MKNQHIRNGVEEKQARNGEAAAFPLLSSALSWPLAFVRARLRGDGYHARSIHHPHLLSLQIPSILRKKGQ